MKIEDIQFPVYRKYKNNKSYFKIINAHEFEQIQVVGAKKIVSHTEAKLFPEMSFVRDLIFNYEEMAVEIGEREYEEVINEGL